MPKKRASSPAPAPVAKRKRPVSTSSTAPEAITAKDTIVPEKAEASNATASKTIAPKSPGTDATIIVKSHASDKASSHDEQTSKPELNEDDDDREDSEKQPELEICPMCEEEYDPGDEDDESICYFHPGRSTIQTSPLSRLPNAPFVWTLTSVVTFVQESWYSI